MPRAFTEMEIKQIRSGLIEKGVESLERFGVRRSNVEWIAKQSGISKGSFYHFFRSRESLLFQAFLKVQNQVRQDLKNGLKEQKTGVAELRYLLEFLFHAFEEYPVLGLLGRPEELSNLLRGLSDSELQDEAKSDEQFFEEIFTDMQRRGVIRNYSSAAMSGLPSVALVLTLQKDLIGAERFQATRSMIIDALVRELGVG